MKFNGKWRTPVAVAVLLLAGVLTIAVMWPKDDAPKFTPAPFGMANDEEETPNLPPRAYYHDVTAASGIAFTVRTGEEANHHSLLESLGGGVALFDFDGDGLLDIFLIGGGYFDGPDNKQIKGHPCKLYKNLGNWKFQDVTARVFGDQPPRFYSHGCAVADYDCDGWPDLLVTGYGRLALYHNESDGQGNRRFVDVSAQARLSDDRWNTSAAWADLDGDGYPDLYVCHYVDWTWAAHAECQKSQESPEVCSPRTFRGVPHALFRNNRDGTFTDVSASAGLRLQGPATGMGLGVVIVDVDGDGRPDVYAVNDMTQNFLYLNQSRPGKLQLREVGAESGVAMGNTGNPEGSMGADAADYDGCGRPSLWVSNFEGEQHALYCNDCTAKVTSFSYETFMAGISAIGSSYVGWGTSFVDVDLDGWEDIVVSHGHVFRHPKRAPLRQRPVLFRNLGNKRFLNIAVQGGAYFQKTHRGRALAVGDLDNDGRPDLAITHLHEPVVLLRNDPQGSELPQHHWLGLELRGKNHRDVTGAKIVVEVGGRRLTRFAKGGGSYLSASDRRVLIGLGTATKIERLTVHWPWGGEQHWQGLAIERYWQLVEGEPAARKAP